MAVRPKSKATPYSIRPIASFPQDQATASLKIVNVFFSFGLAVVERIKFAVDAEIVPHEAAKDPDSNGYVADRDVVREFDHRPLAAPAVTVLLTHALQLVMPPLFTNSRNFWKMRIGPGNSAGMAGVVSVAATAGVPTAA